MLLWLASLILLIIFQIVPMPSALLSLLSPATGRLYERFGVQGDASWRTLSIYPGATREELYKLLAYAAVFIVIINHYRTRDQVRAVIRAVLFIGCFLAVFAVVQKITWNGRLYWFYPISESLNPMGPYINRNHFAGYMEMAVPIGLGMLLYRASRLDVPAGLPLVKRVSAVLGSDDFPSVALLSLAVLIMSAALVMSLSRGGMIGFATSMIFFMAMTRSRRSLRKKTGVIVLAGLVIFIFVVLAGWSRIEDRFDELGGERKIERLRVWADTAGMVKDFPVFGTGFGTFGDAYLPYQSTGPGLLYDHAHNDYVELLTDAGLMGALLAAGLLAAFWRSVIKAWRERHRRYVTSVAAGGMASCVAIAAHSMTDFNLHIPANALLLTVIAGITYATVSHGRSGGQEDV
jgi:O-antigen ligase